MLNRHLARIRVLQGLYALEKAKGANYLLAQDVIARSFAPDLNSMEVQDRTKLAGKTKLSHKLLEEYIKGDYDVPEESDIKAAVEKAIKFLDLANKKDLVYYGNQTAQQAERTYDVYLLILNFLLRLSEKPDSVLHRNKALKALKESNQLEVLTSRRALSFTNEDLAAISIFYNDAIVGNQHIEEYVQKVNKTLDADLAIIKYIVKNLIFKHEASELFFEKLHLHWLQDKEILRTMIFHTFKDFVENEEVTIEELDEQWEDTKEFLNTLFKETAERGLELQGYIEPNLKNWNLERVMETDLLLLKMALAELLIFPSIPLKVTINEALEIGKSFSSEKSRIFLNGILDRISKDLIHKGLIKKTGRGMLDNR